MMSTSLRRAGWGAGVRGVGGVRVTPDVADAHHDSFHTTEYDGHADKAPHAQSVTER